MDNTSKYMVIIVGSSCIDYKISTFMPNYQLLESRGLVPFGNYKEIRSVMQLRKAVYLLGVLFIPDVLTILKHSLAISHVDLEGDNDKEKAISLLKYCQEKSLLNAFFEHLEALAPNGFFDGQDIANIQEALKDIDISNLKFDISDQTTCYWKDPSTNKVQHYPMTRRISLQGHPCTTIEVCEVCGLETERNTVHEWTEWQYQNDGECTQIRKCRRKGCGSIEKRIHHQWSQWIKKSNGSCYRYCEHCGDREFEIKGTWYGYAEWKDGIKDYWEVVFSKKKHMLGLYYTDIATVRVLVGFEEAEQEGRYRIQGEVKQDAKVEFYGNTCIIKCKRIIFKDGINSYVLDRFEGKIDKDCKYISGTVSDKNNSSGKLILRYE